MLYLHAGGPVHGKLVNVFDNQHTHYVAEMPTLSFSVLDNPMEAPSFKSHRYERTHVVLFGRELTVYVHSDSYARREDVLFEAIASSVVKAIIK